MIKDAPLTSVGLGLCMCLALAACNKPAQHVAGSAGGEVLPGAASDAMLPLDTVRSQAPLAPKPVASANPNGSSVSNQGPARRPGADGAAADTARTSGGSSPAAAPDVEAEPASQPDE